MSDKTNTFNTYVIRNILANNQFGIKEVLDIESIKSTYFDKEEYSLIEKLVKDGDIVAIKEVPANQNETTEYLDVMIFKDQTGKSYIATVYDSNELWQDPQVIEVYSLNTKAH